jgi:hypothetical protein
MNIDDNLMETNAVIKSDGRVSVYRAMITQITCLLEMDDFPVRLIVCPSVFSSKLNLTTRISLSSVGAVKPYFSIKCTKFLRFFI